MSGTGHLISGLGALHSFLSTVPSIGMGKHLHYWVKEVNIDKWEQRC